MHGTRASFGGTHAHTGGGERDDGKVGLWRGDQRLSSVRSEDVVAERREDRPRANGDGSRRTDGPIDGRVHFAFVTRSGRTLRSIVGPVRPVPRATNARSVAFFCLVLPTVCKSRGRRRGPIPVR